MKIFLIEFRLYRSLGDGEHENKKLTRLVYADTFEEACDKVKVKYKDAEASCFKNLTIE